VLAGTILQHASWRWLFLVNVPVCLAGIVLAALFLPDDSGKRRVRAFDGFGFALLTPGLCCSSETATEIPEVLVIASPVPNFSAAFGARRRGALCQR